MKRYILSVGSMTYALKGRDLLRKLGFKATVERRSKDIGTYGCGYAIVINDDNIDRAISALKNAGIKILKTE